MTIIETPTDLHPTLQQRVAAWHRDSFPEKDRGDVWMKLTEELGELARAMIGQDEGRDGRGDVETEAAQTLIVLLTLCERYLGVDLIAAAIRELNRLESLPRKPWEAA